MTAINVTAEHIASGQRGDCRECPIALAIADTFPDLVFLRVYVENIDIRTRPEEGVVMIESPDQVLDFIRAFDAGRPVAPFSFELDYPAVTS